MIVKADFVTNSSSTSFILADKRKNKPTEIVAEMKIQRELNLLFLDHDKIEKSTELSEVIKNPHHLEEAKEAIKDGGTIYVIYVRDQSGNLTETFLRREGLSCFELPSGVDFIGEE